MAQLLSPDNRRKTHELRDAVFGWIGFAVFAVFVFLPLLQSIFPSR